MSVERVEKLYNRVSSFYDLIYGSEAFSNGRAMAPALLELFTGAKVLEVGVGTGLTIEELPRNIEITGIDFSQKMLNRARRRLGELGLNHVQLLKMDAARLEFPDSSFDRVLAAYFISTVKNPVRVVREMRRVCRPGGLLVFLNHFQSANPFIGAAERILSPLFWQIGFKTGLNLDDLMEQTGLKVEMMERIDGLGHWKAVRCINPH